MIGEKSMKMKRDEKLIMAISRRLPNTVPTNSWLMSRDGLTPGDSSKFTLGFLLTVGTCNNADL